MKRMMSITAVCLASLLPAVAGAEEGNLNSSLRGDYAFSGDAVCVGTGKGFSADYRALPPAHAFSFSVEGVRRFNGDGTGSILNGRSISILHGTTAADVPGQGIGPVTAGTFTGKFKYTVARDRSIHIDQGPITTNETVGPLPHEQAVWAGIQVDGHVSQDFKTITVATAVPTDSRGNPVLNIESRYPNGDLGLAPDQWRACHRSRVMIRIGSGNGRDD